MCGLVATFGLQPRDEAVAMRAALTALAHRGPDGQGLAELAQGRVWMGHRRLALVDLAGGAQPIANEDESIVAIVNGEIYDDLLLRSELTARGHRFRSQSDSELLVHLYEEHGEACVEKICGELAFVLFDQVAGKIFAGRDRFGIKPLVYAVHGGRLCIASEAKALFALGVPAAWDLVSVRHALAHQYLPPGRTLFEGVSALAPGCTLVAKLGGDVAVRRYWTLLPEAEGPGPAPSAADARDQVSVLLTRAVRRRLRSDVAVGAYLSGGLDSTAVLALAAQQDSRIRAFGVAFEHAPYDEAGIAARSAEALGVQFEPVIVRQRDLVDGLADAVRAADGLAINGQLVAKYRLAAAARAAGMGAVLTGEGADEAFLGYPHLRVDHLGASVLRPTDAIASGIMVPSRPAPFASRRALAMVERALGFVPAFLQAKLAFGADLMDLIDPGFAWPMEQSVAALLASLGPLPLSAPPVARSAWLWTQLALHGYIVRTLGDGTEMAHSIEGRPPFLDHELFQYAWSLPVALRLDSTGREKAVLRDALAERIPCEIAVRPKQPFLAPPVLAFGASLDDAHALAVAALPYAPFFDPARTRAWLDHLRHASAKERADAEPVWTTLTTAGLLGKELGLSCSGGG